MFKCVSKNYHHGSTINSLTVCFFKKKKGQHVCDTAEPEPEVKAEAGAEAEALILEFYIPTTRNEQAPHQLDLNSGGRRQYRLFCMLLLSLCVHCFSVFKITIFKCHYQNHNQSKNQPELEPETENYH